jgi:hypothetical protein
MRGGVGGGGVCGVSAKENSCAHGAQINFEDLPPYLTYSIDFDHVDPFSTPSSITVIDSIIHYSQPLFISVNNYSDYLGLGNPSWPRDM